MSYTGLKKITRPDGKRRVSIVVSDDGIYSFFEEKEDLDYLQKACWVPVSFSGIYSNAEDAEQDARLTISWLRDLSN